jgi:hypothetical protein
MTRPAAVPTDHRQLSPETLDALERRLPKLGWSSLPLSLLANVAVLLTAYQIPVHENNTAVVVGSVGAFGAFCGYGSGLILVDMPNLMLTGEHKWRTARILRGLLAAFSGGAALAFSICLVAHGILLIRTADAGPRQVHFTMQAMIYLVFAGTSTAITVLNAFLFSRFVGTSPQRPVSTPR